MFFANVRFLIVFVFCCFYSVLNAENRNIQARVNVGNVVGVYENSDINGNDMIIGLAGLIALPPSTWSYTDLSSSLNTSTNSRPKIYYNNTGDVVVIWQYINLTDHKGYLAAATLCLGGSWSVTTLSSSTENVFNTNFNASLDEIGNVLVTWNSWDSNFVSSTRGVAGFITGIFIVWGSANTIVAP